MKTIKWAIAHTPKGIDLFLWHGKSVQQTYCADLREVKIVLSVERSEGVLQHSTELPIKTP